MTDTSREAHLVDVFTTLADTLVADYDVIDLLQTLVDTTVDIFDVTAAGILLADETGRLDVVVSTSEESRLVETMQLDAEEGPCLESFTTGAAISVPDISAGPARWAKFQGSALEQGFRSVHAIPLRLRDNTIGALNLLREGTGALNNRDVRAAQALADVATIGVLHERTVHESTLVQAQLQRALSTRIVIEQAKGALAHRYGISTDDAFTRLRHDARASSTKLAVLADQIVNDTTIP